MPIYLYRSKETDETFEIMQPITDDALEEHPETGEPVERIIAGGQTIQFKGSGFYETDYKE